MQLRQYRLHFNKSEELPRRRVVLRRAPFAVMIGLIERIVADRKGGHQGQECPSGRRRSRHRLQDRWHWRHGFEIRVREEGVTVAADARRERAFGHLRKLDRVIPANAEVHTPHGSPLSRGWSEPPWRGRSTCSCGLTGRHHEPGCRRTNPASIRGRLPVEPNLQTPQFERL